MQVQLYQAPHFLDGKAGTGWCEFQWDDTYLAHMKKFKHIRR